MLPKVVIIGRPNVGKSTLFNRIVGKKIALTDKTPYLTRDILSEKVTWNNLTFEICDTAGMDFYLKNSLNEKIIQMINSYIGSADLILFVVDGNSQITNLDDQIVNLLRRSFKKVILVVNKVDNFSTLKLDFEFNKFGFKDVFLVSAIHGNGVADLLDFVTNSLKNNISINNLEKDLKIQSKSKSNKDKKIKINNTKHIQDESNEFIDVEEFEPDNLSEDNTNKSNDSLDNYIKIALIGQPNSGKSSYLNKILGYERTLVHDEPGTTRDSINTYIEFEGYNVNLIDTAGIRKNTSSYDNIEFYSVRRSIKSLMKSDVVIILIDITKGITFQDKHLLDLAFENGKGIIIAFNKVDLIKPSAKEQYLNEIINTLHNEFYDTNYVPKFFISVQNNENVFEPLKKAIEIYNNAINLNITTSVLNSYLIEAISLHPPASYKGKPLKIYYSTFVSKTPPTFLMFVNDPKYVSSAYERYLMNKFRLAFNFEGYPIRIIFKKSTSKKNKNKGK